MSYLVIDNGTSGCRAAVVSEGGEIVSQSRAPVQVDLRPPAFAEVDPGHVWGQVVKVVRAEVEKHPGESFRAVGVSSMLGYVFLDGKSEPLMPAVIWMDNRAVEETREILRLISEDELYRRTRRRPSPELLAPKLLWMFKNLPDASARLRKVIGLKDEIVRRLTGKVRTDVAHLNYTMLYNIEKGGLDSDLLEALKIDPALFPEPRLAAETIGGISPEAASATGLKAGIPVIAGTSDGTAAMYGGGVLEAGKAVLVSGTTDVLMMCTPRPPCDPTRTLSVNTGMVPGTFLAGGAMGLAGGTLQRLGALLHASAEQLEERIAALPPGSEGLLFLPGLSGERAPYWKEHLTGGIVGLTLKHRAEHLFRAAMEGTSFRLLKLIQVLRRNGLSPASINVAGGCAQMDAWNRIRADVTGLEVTRLPVTEATVLGTALFCRAALDKSRTLGEAAKEWTGVGRRYAPDRSATDQYRKIFQLFDGCVSATDDIYRGLKELSRHE